MTKHDFAERLRANMSPPERVLWRELRDFGEGIPEVLGFTFRAQEVIRGWIVDFWCEELRLAVEVDGAAFHDAEKDAMRDGVMRRHGIAVLRLAASTVLFRPGTALGIVEVTV